MRNGTTDGVDVNACGDIGREDKLALILASCADDAVDVHRHNDKMLVTTTKRSKVDSNAMSE